MEALWHHQDKEVGKFSGFANVFISFFICFLSCGYTFFFISFFTCILLSGFTSCFIAQWLHVRARPHVLHLDLYFMPERRFVGFVLTL